MDAMLGLEEGDVEETENVENADEKDTDEDELGSKMASKLVSVSVHEGGYGHEDGGYVNAYEDDLDEQEGQKHEESQAFSFDC